VAMGCLCALVVGLIFARAAALLKSPRANEAKGDESRE